MKVSIIGATGTVGSCTAFTLAIQGLAEELVLIGNRQNVLKYHAMDISAATVGHQDVLVRAGSYADMSGSDIVIIAAGVHFPADVPAKERLAPNMPIIQDAAGNIEKACPDAVVITVTNPIDLLNYAVYLATAMDRKKLIGHNLNDSSRFQMIVARSLGIKPSRVQGTVVGEHGSAMVPLFSSVRVDGKPLSLDEDVRHRLREELLNYLVSLRTLKAGRTAAWTTAAGLATIVRAIREDEKRVLGCSAVLTGEYGCESLSVGIPAVIGRDGIHQILEWQLSPGERAEFQNVARALKADARLVEAAIRPGRRLKHNPVRGT